MIPARFEYHRPETLREAVAILRRHPGDAKVTAGGQSLIPLMKMRLAQPGHLVDLGGIDGLAHVDHRDGTIAIGPMTTYHALESSRLIRDRLPMLSEAASIIADLQVRNKGTIGGSLAHADAGADLPAVLIALEARIHTMGGGRPRAVAAERFFVDLFTTTLREQELIREVTIPEAPSRTGMSYQKFANKASHFAVVGVAAAVTLDGHGRSERVRIGVTGAGPRGSRARVAERFLEGKEPTERNLKQGATRIGRGVEFLADLHASAEYRQHLTRVMGYRALAEAVGRAQ